MRLEERRKCAVGRALIAAALMGGTFTSLPRQALAGWRSLTGLLPAHVSRVDHKVSPDSKTVVYVADVDVAGVIDLYAVPVAGSAAPIKLNPPMAGQGVRFFEFTPDGQSVIYTADQEVTNQCRGPVRCA